VLLALTLLIPGLIVPQEQNWDWPLEEMEVIENYAGNRPFPTGRLGEPPVVHGMRLSSELGEVRPIGPGRPIYILPTPEGGINRFLSPLGGMVALGHEGGLRSIYSHLEPMPPFGADPSRPLGTVNGSGAQLGRTLFLGIYDERRRQSVNPRLILPEQEDRFRPVVSELRLYAAGGAQLLWSSEGASTVVRDGTVTLVALVYDRLRVNDRYAPYRVTIFANGAQVVDYTWDTRSVWRRIPVTRAGTEAAVSVEAANVTLVDGTNTIEVVAQDFRGNVEERTFQLTRRGR
jgi:hypothetical protein